MDFQHVLGRVTAHLEAGGRRWAVVGGLAIQLHGLARATQDVDIVTEIEAQPELIAFMESEGYETLYASAGFSNHLHSDPVLGRVDFIYVDRATADRLFAGCQRVPWLGREVAVPGPEHLIAMKVHAMKNDPSRTFREMADIQHLLSRPGVDRAQVKHYFERAGLLERFDEILRIL